MANEVAVAERAETAQLQQISSDTILRYGNADSMSERMVQAFSRWAGITTFFAALGALGVGLLG